MLEQGMNARTALYDTGAEFSLADGDGKRIFGGMDVIELRFRLYD
jgi:hypothetical protein